MADIMVFNFASPTKGYYQIISIPSGSFIVKEYGTSSMVLRVGEPCQILEACRRLIRMAPDAADVADINQYPLYVCDDGQAISLTETSGRKITASEVRPGALLVNGADMFFRDILKRKVKDGVLQA